MSEVTVVLPAYNEEEAIGRVIDEIKALPVDCDILVVDNNSSDDTYNIATYKDVKVITEPKKGKGNAMRRAFQLVSTPYIIMMNSDYTYPARYIEPILYRLSTLDFDVVIGERYERDRQSMSKINALGNRFLSWLASSLYSYKVSDVCTGMWGFKKTTLDKFSLSSDGFTLEADLFVNTARNYCIVDSLPISYRSRTNGSKAKLKGGQRKWQKIANKIFSLWHSLW